jgi:hypothetical protein
MQLQDYGELKKNNTLLGVRHQDVHNDFAELLSTTTVQRSLPGRCGLLYHHSTLKQAQIFCACCLHTCERKAIKALPFLVARSIGELLTNYVNTAQTIAVREGGVQSRVEPRQEFSCNASMFSVAHQSFTEPSELRRLAYRTLLNEPPELLVPGA